MNSTLNIVIYLEYHEIWCSSCSCNINKCLQIPRHLLIIDLQATRIFMSYIVSIIHNYWLLLTEWRDKSSHLSVLQLWFNPKYLLWPNNILKPQRGVESNNVGFAVWSQTGHFTVSRVTMVIYNILQDLKYFFFAT